MDDRRGSTGLSPGKRRRPQLPPTLYAEHVAPYLRFESPVPEMLYAFGGRNRQSGPVADVEMLDTWHNVWVPCPAMPRRRAGSSAASLPSGRILLLGGYDERGIVDGLLKSCDLYDPFSESWQQDGAAPMLRARWGHGCASMDGRVFVVGGCSLKAEAAIPQEAFMETLRGCEVYNPEKDCWQTCGSLQIARSGSRVVALGCQHLAAVGGCDDVFGRALTQSSIEVYDAVSDAWSLLDVGLGIPRTSAAVAAIDGQRLIVAGGAPSQASVEVYSVRAPSGAADSAEGVASHEEVSEKQGISDMPEGRMGCQAALVRLPRRSCAPASTCVAEATPPSLDHRCLVIVGGERCESASGVPPMPRVKQLSSVVAYNLDEWAWCDSSAVPCMSQPRTTMALCTGLGRVSVARCCGPS